MRRSVVPRLFVIAMLAWCGPAVAQIHVDGRLDEPEWAQAQVFDEFRVTQPYTLKTPAVATVARLVSTEAGIAVAFECAHPPSLPRVAPRIERDQRRAADRVNFVIDFDADGKVAYDFAVLLSGSIQDDIVTNEVEFNPDWDPEWLSAVDSDAQGWRVEMLIPWSIVAMRGAGTPTRTVAVYFDRVLGATDERQSWPAASFERGTYISDFARIQIPQYRSAVLDLFPYATVQYDRIRGDSAFKFGADLFWKPSAAFQLSATLNPDFGQVEADELVINFDAIETFFSDKRPFFTENQGFFDLRTPDEGYLVYTRRIGGPRDDVDLAADIDAAVKLNGSAGDLGYGLLAAQEADDVGRSFYVARLFYAAGPTLGIGWLGTLTERPFLDRDAQVQALDLSWRPHDDLLVNAQILASAIDQASTSLGGDGAWLRANWTPGEAWEYELEAVHFGRDLDFNDLGFQRRASLNQMELAGQYTHEVDDEDSRLSSTTWAGEVHLRGNDAGQRLPSALVFEQGNDFRGGGELVLELTLESAGVDDLISRGNGVWRQPPRQSLVLEAATPVRGGWQLRTESTAYQEGLSGWALETIFIVNWLAHDALNFEFEFGPLWSRDWLIWEEAREFGRYARREHAAALNVNWFPGLRHELRLKAQWAAVQARDGRGYTLGDDGDLRANGEARPDFRVNEFGLQLRYRYQIAAQSELYLVYSRGGELEAEDDTRPGSLDLLDEALDLRDADQFLAKVRYRF